MHISRTYGLKNKKGMLNYSFLRKRFGGEICSPEDEDSDEC
jgi:hypothetical protein